MNVIEVDSLHKEYRSLRGGRTVAVDHLDLNVEAGGVFGFLGPNGSGKTTTIRCLLGLGRPTRGACRLFGQNSATELHRVIDKVGSIVEAPALFATFSGAKNLSLLAGIYKLPEERVDAVLETVGLTDRRKDLVKNYSLGMRQRLAIAAALLKDPQLLILDEPANGLDPSGIREIRALLRRLGDEGRTVFVSSHILTEVQQLCDRVAIMARGRCVAQGRVDEVLSRGRRSGVVVRVADSHKALGVLTASGLATLLDEQDLLHVEVDGSDGAIVCEALARHDLFPSEIRPEAVDLETVFLELTEAPEEDAA